MFGTQFSDTWSLVKTPSPFKLFFSRVIVFSSYCLHSGTPKRNGMQQSFWHVGDFPRLPPDVLFVLWAHSSRFETNRMFKRCCSSLWWYDRRLAGIQRCRHFPRHDNVVRCRIVEMNFIQYRWEIFSVDWLRQKPHCMHAGSNTQSQCQPRVGLPFSCLGRVKHSSFSLSVRE